jgi:hypothetical protein
MTATDKVTMELTGASGKKYTVFVYGMDVAFKAVGGVYAFTLATQTAAGGYTHSVLYIGQTGDLSERFGNHHKEECVKRRGANRHCAMVVENEEARLAIEQDLIAAYNPPCNG